jgi:hypothetical protein
MHNANTESEVDERVQIIRNAFGQYPGMSVGLSLMRDFPQKGILFFDCLPIFENPSTHNMLVPVTIFTPQISSTSSNRISVPWTRQ